MALRKENQFPFSVLKYFRAHIVLNFLRFFPYVLLIDYIFFLFCSFVGFFLACPYSNIDHLSEYLALSYMVAWIQGLQKDPKLYTYIQGHVNDLNYSSNNKQM